MKKTAHAGRQRNLNYPNSSKGSATAAQMRAQANQLSETEREALFKKGMQLIYGGSKEIVGRR